MYYMPGSLSVLLALLFSVFVLLKTLDTPFRPLIVMKYHHYIFFMCTSLNKYFIFPKFGMSIGNGLHCQVVALQAQGDVQNIRSSAFYYPQFPEYTNLVGWSSHHEPGRIQTSRYLSGFYHGYHQSTINQSSTGTGQPASARNNGGVSRS